MFEKRGKKLFMTAAASILCISLAACGPVKIEEQKIQANMSENVTEKMTEMELEKAIQDAAQMLTVDFE